MKLGRSTQQTSSHHVSSSMMRSDNTNLYSPTMSQPIQSPVASASASASASHQPRTLPPSSPKSGPSFHLGSLPRFHPAVYQSQSDSNGNQQSSQNSYRPSSYSLDALMQYRELLENIGLTRTSPGPFSPGPSAPRLAPLRSPAPVSPFTLEEPSSYLTAGAGACAGAGAFNPEQTYSDGQQGQSVAREGGRGQQNSQTTPTRR